MPFKVYLSDMSDELMDLRPVLIEQIQKSGMVPVWLEENEKQRPDILDMVKQKIAEADAFISIITYKRSWMPEKGDGRSLCEIECDLAHEAGIPIAMLLPRLSSPSGFYFRMRALGQSPEDAASQKRFWKKVEQTGMVSYFADDADLTRKITQCLNRWAGQGGGMIAAQTAAPAPAAEAASLPATPTDLEALTDRIAEKTAERVEALQLQRQEELAKQALKYNEALRLQPGELVFGRPFDRTQFKCDIFMIMPFASDFDPIYQDIIRPLINELQLTILRGDEFTTARGIVVEEVWSALNHCQFVIVDMTGGNDNVFYELGIAHTLNKPAILLTQADQPEEVPFDVRHLRYLQYRSAPGGLIKLRDDLKTAVTRLLSDLQEGWENS